jgi:hypothetical protein
MKDPVSLCREENTMRLCEYRNATKTALGEIIMDEGDLLREEQRRTSEASCKAFRGVLFARLGTFELNKFRKILKTFRRIVKRLASSWP